MSPAMAQGLARLLDDLVATGQVHVQKTELGPFVEPLTAEEAEQIERWHCEAALYDWRVIEVRDGVLGILHLIAYVPQHPRA